ncbi:MAG: DEAD/DEAH box helicase [Bryobacteraceae bacterium]
MTIPDTPPAGSSPLGFHPLVERWFEKTFAAATEPQQQGWPVVAAGHDVLISAPTGSGKTLTAFLHAIDGLVRDAAAGSLPDETRIVYVSPLKALSNDIHVNLDVPLSGIRAQAEADSVAIATIRTAVRTGDTPAAERAKMGRLAPHILVTTPESLYILLTAEKSRKMLASVQTLIVDEIHAVAGSKRGSHLALSIARLERLAGRKLQKIGLSATVRPIEDVARFLSSSARVIQVGHRRKMELAVEVPRDELGAVSSNENWAEIYDRIAALAQENRTTLVFVNTRRLAERVSHHLSERMGENTVLPHHGSLSRKLRHTAEQKLKNGELRAVVATASLELGIDIGTVDLVCQIGSPRSISIALQRIGRSGHWVSAIPKGRIFATSRDELIESAAVIRAIRRGNLDRLEIPRAPLDVLAQQLVAVAACEEWDEEELYQFVSSAYPYRDLTHADYEAVIEMLSEGIATSRGRRGAFLHRDQVNRRIKGRRGARLTAITNGGAIPDTAQYQVIAEPEGTIVGSLDEDFAIESSAGDIFLLGTTSWRIRRVEPGRVRVEDAHGAAPSVPFWLGEAPGRTRELSDEVSQLREDILASPDPVAMLTDECGLSALAAEQAVEYVQAGARVLGAVPSQKHIIAERFFDEGGGMQLVIHSPFGSRINKAWGLALRKRFCRTFNFELQAAATDDGLNLALSDQHSFPLEAVFDFLSPATVTEVLKQALVAAPMFGARWKWNASRALAVPRFAGGHKVPPPIQRMRSDDLLAAVFPDQAACAENLTGEIRIPSHPLVEETISNCLHEAMDIDGLIAILRGIDDGSIQTSAVDTPEPSPFCHELLNANPYAYLDDAPLEERRARAVQLRRTLPASDATAFGALDTGAIAQAAEEAWPVVRDADELHDALLTLIMLPPVAEWRGYFDELLLANRVAVHEDKWVALERLDQVNDTVAILRGWSDSIGPFTTDAIAVRLGFPESEVREALAHLEAEGQVLRGNFTGTVTEKGGEFCHRRVLARIHRMTLGKLRREIEPVTSAEFLRFLCRWQHVMPGTQLHGVDGLYQVLRQLQGYEISAAAWETSVLPKRIKNYEPELLDRLCLAGEVMWGRLSPHPALETDGSRRVRPSRVAPLAIFLREDADALLPETPHFAPLSPVALDVLSALERRGASFFSDLPRSTKHLASEVEAALWELAAAGRVTADGFENLRSLIDPKRRRGEGRGRWQRPRHATGRWAILDTGSGGANVEFFARLLLDRWGVLFRDLLARETLAPAWRSLLVVLRQWEARGEVRGGRFVSGFVGEQFARPEAVDLLRGLRRSGATGEEVALSLADPLNLTGIILPGPRTSALSQGFLQLRDGVQVEMQQSNSQSDGESVFSIAAL